MFIFKSQFSDLIVSSHVLNYTKLPLVSSSYCTIKITQTFVTQTKLLPPSITSSSSEKKMPLASLRVLSSLTRLWSTRSWPENQMHENLHTYDTSVDSVTVRGNVATRSRYNYARHSANVTHVNCHPESRCISSLVPNLDDVSASDKRCVERVNSRL